MKMIFSAAALMLVLPAAAAADTCQQRIESAAAQVPEPGEGPPAPEQMGLSTEQLQALLASLDAARLAEGAGEQDVCMMVMEGAEAILEKAENGKR